MKLYFRLIFNRDHEQTAIKHVVQLWMATIKLRTTNLWEWLQNGSKDWTAMALPFAEVVFIFVIKLLWGSLALEPTQSMDRKGLQVLFDGNLSPDYKTYLTIILLIYFCRSPLCTTGTWLEAELDSVCLFSVYLWLYDYWPNTENAVLWLVVDNLHEPLSREVSVQKESLQIACSAV